MKFNKNTSLANLLLNEEIARSHQTVDNDPFHYSDDENVKVDMYANDEGSWSVKVDCTTDPSLSYPLQRFPDEGSANHYARQCSDRIIRRRMNENYSLLHHMPQKPVLKEGFFALLIGLVGLLAVKWFSSAFKFTEIAEGEAQNAIKNKESLEELARGILDDDDFEDLKDNGWDLQNNDAHKRVWWSYAADQTKLPPPKLKDANMAWQQLKREDFVWYPPKDGDPEEYNKKYGKFVKAGVYELGGWAVGHMKGWFGQGNDRDTSAIWPGGGDLRMSGKIQKEIDEVVKLQKTMKDEKDPVVYLNFVEDRVCNLLVKLWSQDASTIKKKWWFQLDNERNKRAWKQIEKHRKYWSDYVERIKSVRANIGEEAVEKAFSDDQKPLVKLIQGLDNPEEGDLKKLEEFCKNYDKLVDAFTGDEGGLAENPPSMEDLSQIVDDGFNEKTTISEAVNKLKEAMTPWDEIDAHFEVKKIFMGLIDRRLKDRGQVWMKIHDEDVTKEPETTLTKAFGVKMKGLTSGEKALLAKVDRTYRKIAEWVSHHEKLARGLGIEPFTEEDIRKLLKEKGWDATQQAFDDRWKTSKVPKMSRYLRSQIEAEGVGTFDIKKGGEEEEEENANDDTNGTDDIDTTKGKLSDLLVQCTKDFPNENAKKGDDEIKVMDELQTLVKYVQNAFKDEKKLIEIGQEKAIEDWHIKIEESRTKATEIVKSLFDKEEDSQAEEKTEVYQEYVESIIDVLTSAIADYKFPSAEESTSEKDGDNSSPEGAKSESESENNMGDSYYRKGATLMEMFYGGNPKVKRKQRGYSLGLLNESSMDSFVDLLVEALADDLDE